MEKFNLGGFLVYYNEIDPFSAEWLRQLIKAGHIANGEVDERSIEDVFPDELGGFTQCHFFAGIGVWSYALRCAGWPDDRPVWTGSCPCQPFSTVGKGGGFTDERHLWPSFFHLLEQCKPVTVFGEQVASKGGLAWLDLVCSDLEGAGYAVGTVDSCAAGFGAPHLRQRLYWVADAETIGWNKQHEDVIGSGKRSDQKNLEQRFGSCGLGNHNRRPSPVNGRWGNADWIFCRDGKWRAVEPGSRPLAHGASNRVGRLRGYGNAIVAPQATEFIKAFMSI